MGREDSTKALAPFVLACEWKLRCVESVILNFVLNIFLKLFFEPKIFHLNFCIWAETVFQCFL